MQKVFDEVGTLDVRCYEQYGLSEDILMEHAASSMQRFIDEKFENNSSILIVSGTGNNGADGIALARLLHTKYKVKLFLPFGARSPMAELQLKRASNIGVEVFQSYNILLEDFDVCVDCLFGSGLSRELDQNSNKIIEQLNQQNSYKLSCDIPSGVNKYGIIDSIAFKADTTITMGALKKSLFLDDAKDFVGDIVVADLGVQRELYEVESDCYMLDISDLKLPFRKKASSHKGSFGHLAVVTGCKSGAGILCSEAGFNMGAGLVSVVAHRELNVPHHIMQSHKVPENTTAVAIGMGLGNFEKNEVKEILENDIAKVVDADLFYEDIILDILQKDNVILTPHPKEFCSLLGICGIDNIDVKTLQANRFKYVQIFCEKYPNVVLLLKGANVLIGRNDEIFINPHGTGKLSFGGSGDVLGGMIGSLLAQGYRTVDAAIHGSLAHAKLSIDFEQNDYSMTPYDLIAGIKTL